MSLYGYIYLLKLIIITGWFILLLHYIAVILFIYFLVQITPIYMEIFIKKAEKTQKFMITITILYLYKIKLDSYRITNILTYVKKIKSKMQKFRALFSRKKSKKGLKFYYKLGIFLKNILLDFIKSMVLHKL